MSLLPLLARLSLAASPLDLARRAVAAGDADGDGSLSAAEFEKRIQADPSLLHATFSALDVDRDGKLDAEPFQALGSSDMEKQPVVGKDGKRQQDLRALPWEEKNEQLLPTELPVSLKDACFTQDSVKCVTGDMKFYLNGNVQAFLDGKISPGTFGPLRVFYDSTTNTLVSLDNRRLASMKEACSQDTEGSLAWCDAPAIWVTPDEPKPAGVGDSVRFSWATTADVKCLASESASIVVEYFKEFVPVNCKHIGFKSSSDETYDGNHWTTKDVGQSVKIRIGGRSRGPVQGCQEGDNEGGYVSPHVSWPTDEAYRCSSLAVGKRTDAALRMIRQGWDIDDEQYKKGAAVIGPDGHEHITYALKPTPSALAGYKSLSMAGEAFAGKAPETLEQKQKRLAGNAFSSWKYNLQKRKDARAMEAVKDDPSFSNAYGQIGWGFAL